MKKIISSLIMLVAVTTFAKTENQGQELCRRAAVASFESFALRNLGIVKVQSSEFQSKLVSESSEDSFYQFEVSAIYEGQVILKKTYYGQAGAKLKYPVPVGTDITEEMTTRFCSISETSN